MQFVSLITEWLKQLSETLPVEWFVVIGGFVEEVIGPIPSPLVMTLAGSIGASREFGWWHILLLAVMGGAGKTIASWVLYVLGDKAGHWMVGRWGGLLGLSHATVQRWSTSFNGGWWDDVLLVFLRAVPVMPSSPISVLCGALKINLRTYLVSTFLGYSLRSAFFLWLGYLGTDAYRVIADELELSQILLIILGVGALLGAGATAYYTQRHTRWWRRIMRIGK